MDLVRKCTELRRRVGGASGEVLYRLLAELVAADDWMREHTERHPRAPLVDWDTPVDDPFARAADPAAAKADWHECCERCDDALKRLLQHCRAVFASPPRE